MKNYVLKIECDIFKRLDTLYLIVITNKELKYKHLLRLRK